VAGPTGPVEAASRPRSFQVNVASPAGLLIRVGRPSGSYWMLRAVVGCAAPDPLCPVMRPSPSNVLSWMTPPGSISRLACPAAS